MKTLNGRYAYLFLIAVTLDLFETMDTAEICVYVPDFGRVCVPDPILDMYQKKAACESQNASERDSDFGNARLRNCPTGMVNIGGFCFRDSATLVSKSSVEFFDIPNLSGEINRNFGNDRSGIDITGEKDCPDGLMRIANTCLDPARDCPHGCGGGGAVGAPCPKGTRADQNGNCRQELF